MKIVYVIAVFFAAMACSRTGSSEKSVETVSKDRNPASVIRLDPAGMTIRNRFLPPEGFSRVRQDSLSFGEYLRELPLKSHGAGVRYHDGTIKENHGVYEAVVDLPVGEKDLHQCADAVMRLRAEYLYSRGAFSDIHFNFTNGFRVDYSEWMKGKRIVVRGNHVSWVQSARPSDRYEEFWEYLETIFMYAGTLSLANEMQAVAVDDMQIGDVFIQGGSPGHAVIVVDMAENTQTGERIFMLAQSYMPAQEIQVLVNPLDRDLSPWYPLGFGNKLSTPEWIFGNKDLKRFID